MLDISHPSDRAVLFGIGIPYTYRRHAAFRENVLANETLLITGTAFRPFDCFPDD